MSGATVPGYGQSVIPGPAWLPPMRAGETAGRPIDLGDDLDPSGDSIPSLSNVTVSITRRDGVAIGASDLQVTGSGYPNTLDATLTIVTLGLTAPSGAAGVTYLITLTVNPTAKNAVLVRDCLLTVASQLG